jgi:hypothetical protein
VKKCSGPSSQPSVWYLVPDRNDSHVRGWYVAGPFASEAQAEAKLASLPGATRC